MIKVNKKGKCKTSLSLAKYNEIVTILKGATAKTGSKTNEEYKLLKRFDMVAVNGIFKLVRKRTKGDDLFLYFVANEDIYDRIDKAHIEF